MIRSVVILILTLGSAMMLYAQTPLERMNSIKASDEYYWDEYTHPSADTATVGAVQRLLLYVDVPEGKTLTENDILPSVKFIKMRRTKLTRVFAYVKKKDIGSIINASKTESKEDENSMEANDKNVKHEFALLPIAKELMEKSDFYAAYKYLESQCENENILGYGPMKDAVDIEKLYLAIFDKHTQHIVCVLSPVLIGENRTNLVSGANDTLSRYEDGKHIAIWFNLKQ